MKKVLLSITLASCLFITGCGEKKVELEKNISDNINIDEKGAALVCVSDNDYTELEYVIGSKYVVWVDKEKKVTKIISSEIISSSDKTKLDEFENYLSENHEIASQYDGYEYDIKREKNKVTSRVEIDYSKFDLQKFDEENDSVNSSDINLTLDSVEKKYVSLGAKCTRK